MLNQTVDELLCTDHMINIINSMANKTNSIPELTKFIGIIEKH